MRSPGVHDNSAKITVLAAVNVKPTPPAFIDSCTHWHFNISNLWPKHDERNYRYLICNEIKLSYHCCLDIIFLLKFSNQSLSWSRRGTPINPNAMHFLLLQSCLEDLNRRIYGKKISIDFKGLTRKSLCIASSMGWWCANIRNLQPACNNHNIWRLRPQHDIQSNPQKARGGRGEGGFGGLEPSACRNWNCDSFNKHGMSWQNRTSSEK